MALTPSLSRHPSPVTTGEGPGVRVCANGAKQYMFISA